jgi:hypothetical protein
LADLAFSAKAYFASLPLGLYVLCLPGIGLERNRLVPNILDLVDFIGRADRAAHGVVAPRSTSARSCVCKNSESLNSRAGAKRGYPMERSPDDYDFVLNWLRQFGAALAKESRHVASVNAAGRFQLTLEYDSALDLLAVAEQLDALEWMAREDMAALALC